MASFGLNTLSEDFERESILNENERYNKTTNINISSTKKKKLDLQIKKMIIILI